ncbi:double-strand break repair helicase AddA [Kaistia dalseonensis]|uniref:DNA 3'-5' helicase n=1 Tax=Kaistia dalseonensis TaxID=410840 RepID=A0ABU0H5C8_9HYPH|nr:double-strand break repair helicase AddA [Kaistia dalseonensis]MCX5494932.1 double-strand break repair helicase AddA [Kaistia dalseonensis]MDQ0437513.1 ATP-dependent helicase/nuclease subunit A [Kaistia dalseonensis]
MSAIVVDAHTRETQGKATDPEASAWVSANAGSGKTYVLARRVIRLLLAGADPGAILCLTFTKAAAAEMASRVFSILADWTTLDDAALDAILADYQGAATNADMRIRARRLFARALETPGGLKIQTIHAFCERLLHQFPFEANVAGSFEVLDDRASAILTETAQRDVIARAASGPETELGRAFARVLDAASDQGIEAALAAIIGQRDALRELTARAGSFAGGLAALRRSLGLKPGEDSAELRAEIVSDMPFTAGEIAQLVERLAASGANDKKGALRLAPFVTAETVADEGDAWLSFLMTGDGKKMREVSSLAAKAIRDGWPGLEERLLDERERIADLLDRIAAAEAFAATEALLTLGDAVVAAYERAKHARGALDFQDLVVKTAYLLSRSEASAWVHYKLDRGLEHILVDEAQDTSPRQWQVITGLAEEFFAGVAARATPRTFFAVGDEKQSIYSFQGAVPAWFARQRARIGQQAADVEARFDALELNLSFRSTADVLGAVDRVFSAPDAHRGLTQDPQPTVHVAARRGDPGRVTVWPLIAAEKTPEPEDWHTPLDRLDEKSPEVRLAERIARTIKGWTDRGETIDATGRKIRPGNILILTRKRGAQTDAINRALKAAGLAVAGADRLALGSHIAVLDLLAVADIVLQPRDDLALAALLKSPLVGLGEEQLFDLAHGRSGTLWRAVADADAPEIAAAAALLAEWRDRADFMSPYAFFARILGPDGGRRRLIARLGPEADDVLDEFLAQALAHEQTEVPSLQGFAAWMREAATEIKRDADLARDEIRVMTVHGAKGLEAEIVFLVDTGSKPVHASHDPKIVALADDPDDSEGAPLVWVAPGARRPAAVETALATLRDKAREEYRRLLYVGLTRARDRLIVCGTAKANLGGERIWHDLVQSALEVDGHRVEVTLGDDVFESLEWRIGTTSTAVPALEEQPEVTAATALPAWLGRLPPEPAKVMRRLTPSTAVGFAEAEPAFPPVTALDARLDPMAKSALDRGRLVHRLLQALPDHPPEARLDVAVSYLDAVVPDWPAAMREALADSVLGVIHSGDFAPLFGPGSRAEVPIAGVVETRSGPASVSGRIDRLVVSHGRVMIVDYKTNRPAPTTLEAVPETYFAQLALYRAILRALYPDLPIETALLWTEVPTLMPIPGEWLDERLAAIVAA